MNYCEECSVIDDAMELPTPVRTITNSTFAGKMAIEAAFNEDEQDFVSEVLPDLLLINELRDDIIHGAVLDEMRWCTPCNNHFNMIRHPDKCPMCRAPWDRPITATI